MTHLEAVARAVDWIFEACKPEEQEGVIRMDRFSVPWEGEYHECFNACRKCGEEWCECPQPCPHDPSIRCGKVATCEEYCGEDEEDEICR